MKQIYANNCTTLQLGRHGENLARKVAFDLSDWVSEYGAGTAELIYQRPGDSAPYPVAAVLDGDTLVWTLTATDTDCQTNYGRCELRYYVGETLAKSKTWRTWVEPTMDTPSEEAPPEPQKGWVDQVLSASVGAMQAAEKAEDAITKAPKIGENGNWYIWDATQGTYVDTGRYAGGIVPYIGANGNWFIGTEDSGVAATGPRGPAGKDGAAGKPGKDGLPGKDGAPGKDGYTPIKGVDYFDGDPGQPGKDGRDGIDGKDGYTPQKGIDYFDGKDGKDYVLTDSDRSEIASIVETNIEPTLTEIRATAEQAETIARGRATGYVFDTIDDMNSALEDPEFVANLVLGDNLYIRATDVPDYWWDGEQAQKLETEKPDFSNLPNRVFVCQFDVTTFDEVSQALADGSLPVLKRGNQLYIYNETYGGNIHIFLTHYSAYSGSSRCQVNKSNAWSYSSMNTIIDSAADSMISGRNNKSFAITTVNYDYAVKTAMCDGKGAAWTDAEKTGAWKRLNSIKTTMDEIAVAGAQYYLGEQTAVSVVLPDDAEVGQMVTVSWYNGATAATLSITGTMLGFDYTPSANTRSEINALWDGTYWAVLGNEMEVPSA